MSWVLIVSDERALAVGMGEGAAQPMSGFGGWEKKARPDDVAITHWAGVEPLTYTLPLLLDGHATNTGVERDLERILKLGRTNDADEPPRFRVYGPIPFSGMKVVMETTPEFGEAIRNEAGKLVRQALTLTLMEYVAPDRIKIRKKGGGGGGGAKTYRVKEGDTLQSIAKKVGASAKAIGDLNGIRDLRKKLNPGRVLRLP